MYSIEYICTEPIKTIYKMETINLLAHSTYNVEQIRKNREFFASLLDQIKRTYVLHKFSERTERNSTKVSFAPTESRITNVFMGMDVNGVVEISFNGFFGSKEVYLTKLTKKHKQMDYSGGDKCITIENVTYDNYKEYLADIVVCIDGCDYSLK